MPTTEAILSGTAPGTQLVLASGPVKGKVASILTTVQEKVEESVEGGETKTSSNKKAEKKSSAPKKPKSKMESITQGLSAIKGYSGALKSVQ